VIKFQAAHRTHVGLVREHNEDHIEVWQPNDDGDGLLGVVADGLGGHAAGEVASEIAVRHVLDAYQANGTDDIGTILASAILRAHDEILEHAGADPTLHGMGTTCTAVALTDGKLYVAHVGDSRAYRWRSGLERLTRDHTVAEALVSESVILPEDADNHPGAHVLTRALGMAERLQIDVLDPPEPIEEGDAILICSDGLTGHVSDAEIAEALQTMDPNAACDHLVQRACDGGGQDNISVAILRADG